MRDDGKAEGISPYFFWAIWLMWLPFLIQPAIDLLQMPASLRKAAAVIGLLLFIGAYLWATWQEASRLADAAPPGAGSTRRSWAPLALMVALDIALPFVQGSWGLGGMIFTSAGVAGWLTIRQTALVLAGLMLLSVILGIIAAVPWGAIALVLFLVPVVGVTVAAFSRTVQTNRELRLARREIARLAVSEERLRVARDLHDSVKQHLFALSMQVGAALAQVGNGSEAARHHLQEADTLISQTQQELTGLIHELRPSALQQQGLAAALREQALNWSRQRGIAVDLDLAEGCRAPAAVEEAFWRIAQEALSNVARHSQAARVEMRLQTAPQEVTLSIADNGRGFDPASARQSGIGLHSMRERMAAVGGTVTIESRPGVGTALTARCPVPQGAARHL